MIQTGSSKLKLNPICAVITAVLLITSSTALFAQNAPAAAPGPEMQNWKAPDKSGDGKAEVVLADGVDPAGCRISVSVKGNSCTKVMCKGEQPIFTNSSQSIMAAKRISLSMAKAHYVHFLQEEINSKRATDVIDAAIKKEGGADAGTKATSGYVSSQTIREQASQLIKGFSVVEDGVTVEGSNKVAYTIGGVSCVTQKAADNLSAGNKTNMANGQRGNAQNANLDQESQPSSSRRRALDEM